MSGALPFGPLLRQPDGFSCGAACLVVARMLLDQAYAARSAADFGREVRATHRRVTGPRTAVGGLQSPWPRGLGTPPWAVAAELSGRSAAYRTRLVGRRRSQAWDEVLDAVRAGRPVAIFVGDRWLPRHVVLGVGTVDDDLGCYDPARGVLVEVDRGAFVGDRLPFGRWVRPWLVVLPRVSGPRPGRRTPA